MKQTAKSKEDEFDVFLDLKANTVKDGDQLTELSNYDIHSKSDPSSRRYYFLYSSIFHCLFTRRNQRCCLHPDDNFGCTSDRILCTEPKINV